MGVGAGQIDDAGLQRLTQRLDGVARELRKFVEEQHAEVGQRNFAGPGPPAAADQRRHRRRMVGRAERPPRTDAATGQQPGKAVDHADFEHLARLQLRQQPRQPLRQH